MGKYNKPVKTSCWKNFLEYKKCDFLGINKHEKWDCPNCDRPIVFRHQYKEIPRIHINSNLKTMQIPISEFNKWLDANC